MSQECWCLGLQWLVGSLRGVSFRQGRGSGYLEHVLQGILSLTRTQQEAELKGLAAPAADRREAGRARHLLAVSGRYSSCTRVPLVLWHVATGEQAPAGSPGVTEGRPRALPGPTSAGGSRAPPTTLREPAPRLVLGKATLVVCPRGESYSPGQVKTVLVAFVVTLPRSAPYYNNGVCV